MEKGKTKGHLRKQFLVVALSTPQIWGEIYSTDDIQEIQTGHESTGQTTLISQAWIQQRIGDLSTCLKKYFAELGPQCTVNCN